MKNISCLIFILLSLVGCSGTARSDSKIKEQDKIEIIRLDKELYNYIKNPTIDIQNNLEKKYPTLLSALGYTTINKSFKTDSSNFFPALREYYSHPMLSKIYEDALKTFEDASPYEDQLTKASIILDEHLSGRELPHFAMHVSGFKENVILTEYYYISISIDKYLGKDYAGYKTFFKDYQLQQMQPKMIARDYLRAYLYSITSEKAKEKETTSDLLSQMVNEGKILYILSLLLPDYDTSDLIGYTSKQTEWCKENEKMVWESLMKQKALFSTDHQSVVKYIDDAPYTIGFSNESPGRIGCWVGWQIVNQYMKKTDASIKALIDMDTQTILKLSKYNP